MMPALSPNTQAALLLTAPLIVGRVAPSSDPLSLGEYKRLARHLHEMQRQPADLLSPDAPRMLDACDKVIGRDRLRGLLGRGFLLSEAVERWQARAIWVVGRADAQYPQRLKERLRENTPVVIYGCGDMSLLNSGGLAVVGSRHASDFLEDYAASVGALAARADKTIVSGGARGIDLAAMRGALQAGGRACGILADSLERTVVNREHRDSILDGRLALVSPYDPNAGFNTGNAMQRNKLIYALADASLVVNSDLHKGGTWTGAVEQLEKFRFGSVFVRSTGNSSVGLDGLLRKGALPWPNPRDPESLKEAFEVEATAVPSQIGIGFAGEGPFPDENSASKPLQPHTPADSHGSEALEAPTSIAAAPLASRASKTDSPSIDTAPAEAIFATVRLVTQRILDTPMKDTDIADVLDIPPAVVRRWLQRLVEEGVLEKQRKPPRYVVKRQSLFN